MSLTAGTRLGPYEVIGSLGAGGMGEVYRARDSKLGRDVAIKVLPSSFASDTVRLQRFSQEARAASALNHPNILTIHELGTHEGAPYIVAELLEGTELRALMTGKPMPARKVIDYGLQILNGLAAAHEKGIVHRDLKPENIFVTRDGRVKILDFGLAKLDQAAGDATQPRLTDAGIVMGTVGYMSPEQVRGQAATDRSDLFSFGVVIYELLSGRRAFARETGAETMTAVLNDEPRELSDGEVTVHPALEKIVRRCMEKSPDRRFHSADDLGFALGTVQTLSDARPASGSADAARSGSAPGHATSRARERVLWAVATVILISAAVALSRAWPPDAPVSAGAALRLSFPPPDKTSFGHVAVSPDGRWVAFTGTTGASVQLWVRAMGEAVSRPLAGTEGAVLPFWSPDSRFIGYFAAGKLRKIDLHGGVSTALADSGVSTGGTWSRDGTIVFGSLGGSGLSKVPAAGGAVETVRAPDLSRQETEVYNPWFLPDGRHYFYNIFSGQREGRGIFLSSLDGTVNRRITADSSNGVYALVPGAGGFLLFVRENALVAQPFDADALALTGEPTPVADHVGSIFDNGTGVIRRNFSVSQTGLIVLDPVRGRLQSHLVWVDRNGARSQPVDGMTNVSMVKLSRDGRRFAVARLESQAGNSDLWVAAAEGGEATRLTFDPANDPFPVWSPDGQQIAWGSNRDGVYHLYQRDASGSGQDTLIFKGPQFKLPTDWSPDGKYILFRQIDPATHYDIWALPVGAADPKPFPVLQSDANEAGAVLSPDGKWLAYGSDESGRYEVYLQGFPAGGGKRQVSTAGGNSPQWRADGRELFFHALDGKLMATTVQGGSSVTTTAPVALFEFAPGGNLVTPYYTVTPDGRRFLLSTLIESDASAPMAVVVDWPLLLQRRP